MEQGPVGGNPPGGVIPVPTQTYPPEGGLPDPATLVETHELTFSPLHAEAS